MDSRFVETLLAVVDIGSYAGAARRQNLTPAAVSQRVKSLEIALGKALFVRAGQQVAPTPACHSILRRLRHIVDEVDLIHNDLDPSGLTGRLRLGAISTALADRVPDILKRAAHDAPQAVISIIPGTSASLFEKLEAAELDASLLIRPPFQLPKSLYCVSLETQPSVFVSAATDDRSIAEIMARERALIYDPASWGGKMLQPWVLQNLRPDRILCELDALETIAIGVGQGLGYSVLPDWPGLAGLAEVRRRPLPGIKLNRELVMLHRSLPNAVIKLVTR